MCRVVAAASVYISDEILRYTPVCRQVPGKISQLDAHDLIYIARNRYSSFVQLIVCHHNPTERNVNKSYFCIFLRSSLDITLTLNARAFFSHSAEFIEMKKK